MSFEYNTHDCSVGLLLSHPSLALTLVLLKVHRLCDATLGMGDHQTRSNGTMLKNLYHMVKKSSPSALVFS